MHATACTCVQVCVVCMSVAPGRDCEVTLVADAASCCYRYGRVHRSGQADLRPAGGWGPTQEYRATSAASLRLLACVPFPQSDRRARSTAPAPWHLVAYTHVRDHRH